MKAVMNVLFFLLLGACGGKDDTGADVACEPGSSVIEGTIGGGAWTFDHGSTDSFLSDEDYFWADFYSADKSGASLIMSISREPSSYNLSLSTNGTFVYVDDEGVYQNMVVTDGHVDVDEVTETLVSGSLCATYDSDNSVSGTFTIDVQK